MGTLTTIKWGTTDWQTNLQQNMKMGEKREHELASEILLLSTVSAMFIS